MRLLPALLQPTDAASLAAFRMAFGVLMAWEAARHLAGGTIARFYTGPTYHFTYAGFDWVRPLPHPLMVALFAGLAVLALALMLGYRYRLSAAVFCLGYTYVFLLERAAYQNHYYLICLLSVLMAWLPAHRAASVDAWRAGLRPPAIPAWQLWLLRAQFAVVYLYGAAAKVNGDWLHGEPMRSQLSWHADPVLTLLRSFMSDEVLVRFFAWGGLAVDLLAVPLLLWRRTRGAAFAMTIVFHLLNAKLWDIGVFPWLMIAGTALFLPPSWPRSFWRTGWVTRSRPPRPASARPGFGLACAAVYLAIQIAVPLRQYAAAGNPSWTSAGDLFAWRMKLRYKMGSSRVFLIDPSSGGVEEADLTAHLSPWQQSAMNQAPDLLRQLSRHLARQAEAQTGRRPEVHVLALAALNGRAPQLLVDPSVDAAAPSPAAEDWIMPLVRRLPYEEQRTRTADDTRREEDYAAHWGRIRAWCAPGARRAVCAPLEALR